MPLVNVKTLRGALSDELKAELHKKITDVMIEVEGRGKEQFRPYVMVMIEEMEPQNASIGGRQASAEFVEKITGNRS